MGLLDDLNKIMDSLADGVSALGELPVLLYDILLYGSITIGVVIILVGGAYAIHEVRSTDAISVNLPKLPGF